MKLFDVWKLTVLVVALPLMLGCPVRPLTINPGFAFFEVQQASATKDIIEISQDDLAENFFDPGSLALNATIPLVGSPIGRSSLVDADLDQTDTMIEVLDQIELPRIGSQSTVQIELVELHLVSVQPIEVTYSGSQTVEFWDVGVTLSVEPQVPGTLNVSRTGQQSGTANGQLPVILEVEFVRQTDDAERRLEVAQSLNLPEFNWVAYPNEVNWPQNYRTNMVPGLGMIPLVGNLFRREQVQANDTELLIFITPTIIRSDR